jgi:hypothetical protein
VSFFYGLPRPTGDIDYYAAIPASVDLQGLAGSGSPLARRHKVCLQRVSVNNMPEEYEARLKEKFPRLFNNLPFFAPDSYDLMLSKWERNSGKDRDGAAYLFKELSLTPEIPRDR